MNTAFLALLIATTPAATPTNSNTVDIHETVATEITQTSQTGSLLFSQGDCLAVRAYTNSSYTHVATIVYEENGTATVYDSMNGPGVRKLPIEEYLKTQAPDQIRLFHPIRKFTKEEAASFRDRLDSELGRPYAVKHHITGNRAKGIHCAEYVTDALSEIKWLEVENSPRVSPASLVEGITLHNVYTQGSTIDLPLRLEPIPEPDGYCEKIWIDTKVCVVQCCSKLSGWVLCR